ncbi:MAG: MBOAT family O-acyltransferase, partial [Verrucomicrobiota bacterium]
GYSLIAIGLGRLFGYRFPINFNFPYIATSFSEFWRRWHISLSSWLRDYLYVPLGGNRAGRIRTYVNLFLVMLLGGLWHGAAWSYAVWGAAHGLFLAAERLLSRQKAGATPSVLGQLLRMTWVFTVVSFLWLLFVLPDFSKALLYFQAIAENRAGVTARNAFTVLLFGSPIVLYHVYGMLRERMGQQAFLSRGSRLLDPCVYGLLLWLIFVNSGSSGSFIYFQF